MPKPKTSAKLLDECAVHLQKIVRMKAALHKGSQLIECITCGNTHHWKEMHGAHFIPRGKAIHKIREENIHPSCVSCNTFRAEAAKVPYTFYMIDMYGEEFVRELEATKNNVCKRSKAELMETKAELAAQSRKLQDECEYL